MKMEKILVLGNKGTQGHVLEKYLKEKGYEVTRLNRNHIDAENYYKLIQLINLIKPEIIVNCIGILKPNSKNRFENAKINIGLPLVLADYCKDTGKKLIHLSTNCIFADIGPHGEDEEPTATDLYGMSKAFGEVNDGHNLTIRTSITGPELKRGCNLFDWFVNQSSKEVTGFDNAHWSGVSTFQLAKFIEECIEKDTKGLINYYTKEATSKYDFLCMLNKLYDLKKEVKSETREGVHSSLLMGEYFTDKTLEEQFKELKEWYKN